MAKKSPKKSQKKCPVGKIENPATGKCVNTDGIIGKAILAKKSPKKSPKKSSSKKCPAGKIENPATGKCVNIDGVIGKAILANKPIVVPAGPGIPSKFIKIVEDCSQNKIFKKRKLVGKGKYGSAYIACKEGKCNYVIKIQEAYEEFFIEVTAIQELQKTKTVPKLFAAWTCEGYGYYVMEKLYPIEKCNLTPVQLWIQVGKHLATIRAAGWLHVDTHINNVMCTSEGKLVLIDFGFAVKRTAQGDDQSYPNYIMSQPNWYNFPLTWKYLEIAQENTFQLIFNQGYYTPRFSYNFSSRMPTKSEKIAYESAVKNYKKAREELCKKGCQHACYKI